MSFCLCLLSYILSLLLHFFFFFFNDPATTEIYTLSLHDALPILPPRVIEPLSVEQVERFWSSFRTARDIAKTGRSEEHTSELQSPMYLVCRLLLEKKKKKNKKEKQKHRRKYAHISSKERAWKETK